MFGPLSTIGKMLLRFRYFIEDVYINSYVTRINGLELGKNVKFEGKPWISIAREARIIIGSNCNFKSAFHSNFAGINHPCILAAIGANSLIHVGRKSGMSGATIVAAQKIVIGDNVGIGANSSVYDSDFHSVDANFRKQNNLEGIGCSPVEIGNDVWIAANVMILKGVTIGDRSVVGVGSIVTKDIPSDCFYAGNPARFIKRIG